MSLAHKRELLRWAKRRAKKARLAFTMTTDDFEIPEVCPVFGTRLRKNSGGKCQGPSSPTLDRLIPSRGYVPGNVIVVSALANQIKSVATVEQLSRVASFYRMRMKGVR